jgi:hypothetical protein
LRADQDQVSSGPQPDSAQWRMLCVIARDAIAAACERGVSTADFGGYRLSAQRISSGGAVAIRVTFRLAPPGDSGLADSVRTEVALPIEAESASSIAWRCACGQVVCKEDFSMAESARLMRVTHRLEPVRSPENREPQGSEKSCLLQPSRGVPSPRRGWSSHFCVPCP